MLSSLQHKLSSLVHDHRDTLDQAKEKMNVVTASFSSSRNWDYSVTFIGAKDLARGDLLSSDPFLEAYLGSPDDPSSLCFVTGVQWFTLNPTWNATWELVNVPENAVLEILIKDKDKMKEDTDLGKTSLVFSGLPLEGTREHTLDIWRTESRKRGQLFIKTVAKKSTGHTGQLSYPTTRGPARYSRHTSYAAGMLTRDSSFEFYTYRIRLYHLLDIFGSDEREYQHWNSDYDGANRIFADTLEGLNIRNAIHSQHSYLYRHDKTSLYGSLATAQDLATLLHEQRLKADPNLDLKMVVFTYSIVPKGLYFSETGVAFFQDFMSKHAMHANRAPSVMYAGEFRLFRERERDPHHHNNNTNNYNSNNNSSSNDWTLLIDNNSGTYAPKKQDLYKLKKLFEMNFPDLVVVAMDHDDPYLKQIRASTKQAEQEQAARQSQRWTLFGNMTSKNDDAGLEV
ncbi:hypothetical protein BG004_008286 [Podila humilis]|nr:hypothetical protein BG004_008286 [Podila humilis]